MLRYALPAALGLLIAAPAFAEAPGSVTPAENERFTITPTAGGYLRLNKDTGAVSFCTVKDGLAACRLAAEERAAMEAEIERLHRENDALKARAEAAPGKPAPPATPPRMTPSDEEFERALSFTERFLRSIMRIFREEAPGGNRL